MSPLLAIAAFLVPIQDTPEAALGRIRATIQPLLAVSQPPLYERHLKSVLALSEAEVIKLRLGAGDAQSKEVLGYLQTIDTGLKDDGNNPDTYLKAGRRALTMARLSRLDGSLQYCTVGLPPNWDPNKAYPLVLGLHGAGPRIPLAYVNFTFMPHGPNPGTPREVITIIPWGRGNRGWRDDGETDLWEAVDDVKTFAKFDPDRWYITGHSMGADGVWAITQRTPDLWAAAGMMAGSTYAAPPALGLVPNIASLPFHIWIGDKDSNPDRIPSSQEARDSLIAAGNKPVFVLSEGVGHSPRDEDNKGQMDWMLQHVRKRPNHFVYTVDSYRHRGVWGITMRRKYPRPTMPEPIVKIECWVEGQKVRIKTTGGEKLMVDMGPNGLNLNGEVELIVNDKSVHKGPVPASPLELTL